MFSGKTLALIALLLVGAPGSAAAQTPADPASCTTHLPLNIRADQSLVPIIEQALAQSATIRRQCQTIAAVPHARVDVHLRSGRLIAGARAEGRIVHYEFGAITAEIFIPICIDQIEMLAHELEHVIEQIDGVDLAERSTVARQRRIAAIGRRVRNGTRPGRRPRGGAGARPVCRAHAIDEARLS